MTDSSGAVIAGATVTATHVETGFQSSATTNEEGIYTIAQLREGAYTVRARSSGFKEFVAQGVFLVSRDLRRLDISLEVGTVETAIEVSAGATLIETETTRLAEHKQRQAAAPADWGWAGDLGRITEQLAYVLADLGDRSAVDAKGLEY